MKSDPIRYHQNPAELIFLFGIEPFSYHCWGLSTTLEAQPMLGGSGIPKEISSYAPAMENILEPVPAKRGARSEHSQ